MLIHQLWLIWAGGLLQTHAHLDDSVIIGYLIMLNEERFIHFGSPRVGLSNINHP